MLLVEINCKNSQMNKTLKILLKWLPSIAIVTFFLFKIDFNKIWIILKRVELIYLIFIFLIYVTDRFFMAYKWEVL